MLQTLLQKRSNGYYYFRWVCPPAIREILGKREIIKSLRTTSKIQALARAGSYYMVVERLKELEVRLRDIREPIGSAKSSGTALNFSGKSYSDHLRDLDDSFRQVMAICDPVLSELGTLYKAPTLSGAREAARQVHEQLLAHCEAVTNFDGEYGEGQSIWDYMSNLLLDASDANGTKRFKDPAKYLHSLPPEDMNDYLRDLVIFYLSQFCLISMELDGNNHIYLPEIERSIVKYLSAVANKLDPERQKIQWLDKQGRGVNHRPMAQIPAPPPQKLLSDLYREFIEYKTTHESLSEKNAQVYGVYFSGIIHFVGDISIDKITKRI